MQPFKKDPHTTMSVSQLNTDQYLISMSDVYQFCRVLKCKNQKPCCSVVTSLPCLPSFVKNRFKVKLIKLDPPEATNGSPRSQESDIEEVCVFLSTGVQTTHLYCGGRSLQECSGPVGASEPIVGGQW